MNEKYIIGKTLLVCLNIFSSENEFLKREQFYGKIKSVDDDIITVCTTDGDVRTLPADFSALRNAEIGVYTFEDGRTVEDPDFVSVWNIVSPE